HRPQLSPAYTELAAGLDGLLEQPVQRPLRRPPERGGVDGGGLRGPGVLARAPALERGQRVVGQPVRRGAREAVRLRRLGEGGGEGGDVLVGEAPDGRAGGVVRGGRRGGLGGRASGEETEGESGGAGHGRDDLARRGAWRRVSRSDRVSTSAGWCSRSPPEAIHRIAAEV